jgi:hypothetical protein
MSYPKVGDWLQFLGAVLATSTGVALWFAERRRLASLDEDRERRRRAEFKATILLALDDLASQIHAVVITADTALGNLAELHSGQVSDEQSITGAFSDALEQEAFRSTSKLRILPSPVLELSHWHVRYLNQSESSASIAALSGARKLDHLLLERSLSTNGVEEAIDTLHVVADAARAVLQRVDSLKGQFGLTHDGSP